MDCKSARSLLDAYVDRELDLVHSVEIERHLEDCPACLAAQKSRAAVRSAIREHAPRYTAPAGIEKRLRSAIRESDRRETIRPRLLWGLATAAAVLFMFGVLTWSLLDERAGRGAGVIAEQVVASHVRSLLADHLFDVASTDQHTVKPWFTATGKLDYSPEVVDLSSDGFPLVGGRLDYVDGRTVAALIYRRARHVINLFVWPAGDRRESADSSRNIRGFHTAHWTSAGAAWWAVSDLNSRELNEFEQLIKSRTGG